MVTGLCLFLLLRDKHRRLWCESETKLKTILTVSTMNPKIKPIILKLRLHLLSFCLLCLTGKTLCQGNGPTVVKVKEGTDAVLPCSLSTKENIELKLFDWKKPAQKDDRQKEVFFYDAGVHYNNGRSGQSEEFKDRVFHFPEELKHGNASIIIRNTKMVDSGNYTCDFPRLDPRQTFNIELVVGTCPMLHLNILGSTKDGVLVQCKVQGASPKPKVEWKDRAGNKLPAEEPQVTDRGDILLHTTVTKTDTYSCVVTQEDICHQISADTLVLVNGAAPEPSVTVLEQTKDWSHLQCVVRGASPKPKVEWKDGSGNKLPAEKPQVTERGGSYDIILQTTVKKTDYYHCVVTQEEINHQTETKIYVYIPGFPIVAVVVTFFCTLLVVGVVLAVLVYKGCISRNCNKGSATDKHEVSVVPLNSQPSRSSDPET